MKEPVRFIRKQEVLRRVPISNTSLYHKIKAGDFPAPVRLGPQAVAWVESEVAEWMAARIAERLVKL